MENKWITAIIFVISSLLAVLIAYFIPLKVSNKTKLIWAGIAVGCSLLIVGLSQVVSMYIAIILSVVLGLTTIILLWSKGIGKENDEEEIEEQDDFYEVEGNGEHSIVYPSSDNRGNKSEESLPSKNEPILEDLLLTDEVEVPKTSIEQNLMVEPITLEKKEQETNELTEDSESLQQPTEQLVTSSLDRKQNLLSDDEIQTLSKDLHVDFEEIEMEDFEREPISKQEPDHNVDVDSPEVEELTEQESALSDIGQEEPEGNDSASGDSQIDSIEEALANISGIEGVVSELEADELVASSNIDFDEIEIEEEPEEPEVSLELEDFETGDAEVVVNEPLEVEVETIEEVLGEESSTEMVSELEADELASSSNIDFDKIEIEEEPEEPEVSLELEDFETGDAEVVVNEPLEVEVETIEEVLGEESSTEMVSELEADKLASSSNIDFDKIEIEEEPEEPEVSLELEDFETGDAEVVVNEPLEVEVETIEEVLGEESSTEMVSELEADKLASSSNVDFDEIEIEEEPEEPEIRLDLEDFETGDPEVVVMESSEVEEQASENEQFTKNMIGLVIEQLDLLKQLNPAQYEKELLHSLHDGLNEDAFVVLSMHYVEFLKEQNRIDECLAFLQSIEENRVK